jgi:imidazolonepropionase
MSGNLIIRNAAQLVTCSGASAKKGREMSDLAIIADGAVVIENGVIARVGPTRAVLDGLDTSAYSVIDATDRAVLPGFIDPHTHFVFAGYRAEEFSWRLEGMSYMEIMRRGGGIASTVEATRKASKEELARAGMTRLDTMLSYGVTTVEGKSGYGLDKETEIKQLDVMGEIDRRHPVDVVRTFLGAHAVPAAFRDRPDAFIDYLIGDVLPAVSAGRLADFCDVFCEEGVFNLDQSERLLTGAQSGGLGIKLHADEITPLGGAELAARLGAISADHLLHASDAGITAMAEAGVIAVLLPGTAFSLKEPYARARFMIDHGCAVALATDLNPGSCFSESIPLIFSLATLYMGMTPAEAVAAFTINAAAAVGRAGQIGSIDVGKQGDLVVLGFPSYDYIPYHIGVNSVVNVIKKGKLVFDAGSRGRDGAPC